MTNTLLFATVLATNWLPITIDKPNGDGTTRKENWEVGVIVSNRFAVFKADGLTNRVLVSSGIQMPEKSLVREVIPAYFVATNAWRPIWDFRVNPQWEIITNSSARSRTLEIR